MFRALQNKNPHLKLYSVNDTEFKRFGEILDSKPFEKFIEVLKSETEIPHEGNNYVTHHENLYHATSDTAVVHDIFGSMQLQFGYVNGKNSKLNALEFHKSSEINIMGSPCVLFLAHFEDIQEHGIDVSMIKAFYVPENTVIEMFPLTLHFSPCKVLNTGFRCGVILPYGTNMEFIKAQGTCGKKTKYLFKTNKWLLNHPDHVRMRELGASDGIIGPNLEIVV